jgi:hypothetical protein
MNRTAGAVVLGVAGVVVGLELWRIAGEMRRGSYDQQRKARTQAGLFSHDPDNRVDTPRADLAAWALTQAVLGLSIVQIGKQLYPEGSRDVGK